MVRMGQIEGLTNPVAEARELLVFALKNAKLGSLHRESGCGFVPLLRLLAASILPTPIAEPRRRVGDGSQTVGSSVMSASVTRAKRSRRAGSLNSMMGSG